MEVRVFYSVEEAIEGVDIIMMLRIQKERQERGFLPSLSEYIELFPLIVPRKY